MNSVSAPTRSRRSKRDAILAAATRQFGHTGFDQTKWADIADEVGIGQTALYHYYASKTHCLFTLMAHSLERSHRRFVTFTTATESDPLKALGETVLDSFALEDNDVLLNRIFVHEQGRLASRCANEREEYARQAAREWIREIETAWVSFLARGIERRAFREQDPRLLARALLGLCNSTWHWYRPGGPVSLEVVGAHYTFLCIQMVGH
jgi:AcrR family transcriptional regulator